MMCQPLVIHLLILLFSRTHFNGISASSHQDIRLLKVGEELWKETLPLQMGSALYELHGLEPLKWYEVKISYPASIPASFSLRLIRDASDFGLPRLRKLLNTEKLIFQNDNSTNEGPLYALVTVMPEGVVAIPNAKEREFIIFNIAASIAGAKSAAIWCVGSSITTLIAVRKIPWAKSNLNYTAQALIISGATISAYFVTVDKKILQSARSNARYRSD